VRTQHINKTRLRIGSFAFIGRHSAYQLAIGKAKDGTPLFRGDQRERRLQEQWHTFRHEK